MILNLLFSAGVGRRIRVIIRVAEDLATIGRARLVTVVGRLERADH